MLREHCGQGEHESWKVERGLFSGRDMAVAPMNSQKTWQSAQDRASNIPSWLGKGLMRSIPPTEAMGRRTGAGGYHILQ